MSAELSSGLIRGLREKTAWNYDAQHWGQECPGRAAMRNRGSKRTCDVCGKIGAQIRRISRSYGKGANLFVIENVPVVSCPHCGESYLTADTLHEIERIKRHRKSLARERRTAVVTFS